MNASRQAPTEPPSLARRLVPDAAVLAADPQALREVLVDGVVGRLEAEHEDRERPVAGAGLQRLELVDQAAVRGVQARLGERADRFGAARERVEAHRARGAVLGPRLDPHPRARDHAERALGAQQHPVR